MIVRGMGKIPLENQEGKKARAALFARNMLPERKFGFWEASRTATGAKVAPPTFGGTDGRTQEAFEVLKEIQEYAGRILKPVRAVCRICSEVHGVDNTSGNHFPKGAAWFGEYVFAPLEGHYLYRWSEGVLHYHVAHQLDQPHWMAQLITDYRYAQTKGFWKD